MKRQNGTKRSLELLFLSFLILLLSANISFAEETKVMNETCLECHDGMDKTLVNTPHQLNNSSAEINCISCHKGGEVHIEDPSAENISNPKNLSGLDALSACSSCHNPHSQLDDLGFDIHQSQGLNCASCHNVHGGKSSLLLDDNASFCQTCHIDIKQEFSRRSNHPVNQGNINCLNCHSFSRETNNELSFDLNRVCQDCHTEQGGPFLYEHEATTAYTVGGTGCIECHNPHGSENNFLLKQPVKDLCQSCHFVPTHETAHPGRVYPINNCTECHTTHHGSFTSNLFLDPSLNTKYTDNCYQSGCHSLVK